MNIRVLLPQGQAWWNVYCAVSGKASLNLQYKLMFELLLLMFLSFFRFFAILPVHKCKSPKSRAPTIAPVGMMSLALARQTSYPLPCKYLPAPKTKQLKFLFIIIIITIFTLLIVLLPAVSSCYNWVIWHIFSAEMQAGEQMWFSKKKKSFKNGCKTLNIIVGIYDLMWLIGLGFRA